MGVEKRMDSKSSTIKVYTSQADVVLKKLKEEGVVFSKREYVVKKYGQAVAEVFTTVYDWMEGHMKTWLEPPEGAEYPYWAFANLLEIATGDHDNIMILDLPTDQGVFFSARDYTKIMQFQPLGSEEECRRFNEEAKKQGVKDHGQILLTPFYPLLKKQLLKSWDHLFDYQRKVQAGSLSLDEIPHLQAALWCIREDWISGDGK